jgi:HK97 family phage portal protein
MANIFSRMKTAFGQLRSSLENPQSPLSYPAEWLLDIFNGGRTEAGVRVSELTAFQVVTFLTCVDLIAGSIAALPLHIYERNYLTTGRAINRVAYDHDYYDMLHGEPNPEMSRFVFMKAYVAHILAWGNGYAEAQRDGANQLVGLWPRNPAKTRPHRLSQKTTLEPVPWRPFPVTLPPGALVYLTTDGLEVEDQSDAGASASRAERIIPADDMLHVPGLALDGRIGQSVVWLARNTLGLALATEKFGSKYFANFARPGGILELPTNLTPEAKEQARRSWSEAQGGENSHRAAVLPAGFKWTPTGNNPEEAQTQNTQGYLRTQICAMFHVPPHMAGDVDKARATTEQMAQEFVSYALTPWLAAIKQEFKRKLFPHTGIGRTPVNRFFVDFDLHDMLRPDAASREKYYATGRQWGFLNTNAILELEKLNPVNEPWAEKYWMPINMTLTETPLDPSNQDGAGNGEPAPKVPDKPGASPEPEPKPNGKAKDETKAYIAAYSRLFRDSLARVLARKTPNQRDFQQAFGPVLGSLADLFAREVNGEISQETDRFIADYIGGMYRRSAAWTTSDALVADELARAVRALRVASYRDISTQQALAQTNKERAVAAVT